MNTNKEHTTFVVNNTDNVDVRLDRLLRNELNLTQAVIAKSLRFKNIFINGVLVKLLSEKTKLGDKIEIFDIKVEEKTKDTEHEYEANIPISVLKAIKNAIVLENEHIIVLNKPYGIATQSGGSLKYSLDDIMNELFSHQVRIVHRLDKETSGLMVFAKNRVIATELSEAFKNQTVQKTYLAVVSPIPRKNSGSIETFLTKQTSNPFGRVNKMKNIISKKEALEKNAKKAITKFEVIKTDEENNLALVQFEPKTGRTHQIRLHAKHMGSPIIGDHTYNGNTEITRKMNLCSYKLKLPENIHEEIITLTSLPDFFVIQK